MCRSKCPTAREYPQRLSTVLSVIYLIYNEGYSASFGQRWIRDELCGEALRLGRILAALVPDEPEVHGLVALMEFQSSRFAARTDADGSPVLLADQDRTKWDRAQIQRGDGGLVARRRCRPGVGGARTRCKRRWPNATRSRRLPTTPTGPDRAALRGAGPGGAVAGGRPEPRHRGGDDFRTGRARCRSSTSSTGLDESYLLPSVRGELLAQLGRHSRGRRRVRRRGRVGGQRPGTRSTGGQGLARPATLATHAGDAGAGGHRGAVRRVEHVDGDVVVAVAVDEVQPRRGGDEVVRMVTRHRVAGHRVARRRNRVNGRNRCRAADSRGPRLVAHRLSPTGL